MINFLIAGVQKAGTSALDSYLRLHPDIGLAKNKEVHFFDNEKVFKKKKVDFNNYHKNFDFSLHKKRYGESTPIYFYWEQCARRIWEYNTKMKLIIILRNPIERAFSHWNMEYDRNFETKDFSFCIRNEEERLRNSLPEQNRIYSYIERGYYSAQIRRFIRFFPKDQLLFIKYEEFKENQKAELFKIFDFLNVDSKKYNFEHKNIHQRIKHDTMSPDDLKYLIEIFTNDVHEVERLLGWNCKDWINYIL